MATGRHQNRCLWWVSGSCLRQASISVSKAKIKLPLVCVRRPDEQWCSVLIAVLSAPGCSSVLFNAALCCCLQPPHPLTRTEHTLPQRLPLCCISGRLTTISIYPPDWPPGNETLGWLLCLGHCSWCHLLSGWQKGTSALWGDHVSLLFLLSVHIEYIDHASQLNFKQNVQKGILEEWGRRQIGKRSPTSCTVIAARWRHPLLRDWVIKRQKWKHEPNGKRF